MPSGCIEYRSRGNGIKHRYGGLIVIDGKRVTAARAAFMLVRGYIPPGVEVCHTCDNPRCCNVDHLFLGTHSDNMRDCDVKRRRDRRPALTNTDAARVHHLRHSGWTFGQIGRELGISAQAAGMIASGKRHASAIPCPQ
jgi:hypothetical protein